MRVGLVEDGDDDWRRERGGGGERRGWREIRKKVMTTGEPSKAGPDSERRERREERGERREVRRESDARKERSEE